MSCNRYFQFTATAFLIVVSSAITAGASDRGESVAHGIRDIELNQGREFSGQLVDRRAGRGAWIAWALRVLQRDNDCCDRGSRSDGCVARMGLRREAKRCLEMNARLAPRNFWIFGCFLAS